jgi:hypothetical protein
LIDALRLRSAIASKSLSDPTPSTAKAPKSRSLFTKSKWRALQKAIESSMKADSAALEILDRPFKKFL